jgi:hypothetical protein
MLPNKARGYYGHADLWRYYPPSSQGSTDYENENQSYSHGVPQFFARPLLAGPTRRTLLASLGGCSKSPAIVSQPCPALASAILKV